MIHCIPCPTSQCTHTHTHTHTHTTLNGIFVTRENWKPRFKSGKCHRKVTSRHPEVCNSRTHTNTLMSSIGKQRRFLSFHSPLCTSMDVCVLGMGIRLNCLNRSSGELTIDFRLIFNIFILKFTIYRLY